MKWNELIVLYQQYDFSYSNEYVYHHHDMVIQYYINPYLSLFDIKDIKQQDLENCFIQNKGIDLFLIYSTLQSIFSYALNMKIISNNPLINLPRIYPKTFIYK